jgi:ATP-binding cassette subfamily B multidrug efflux pump
MACRRHTPRVLAMLLSGLLAVFEALLFAMLGRVVDWLASTQPSQLFVEHGSTLWVLGRWSWQHCVVALQPPSNRQTLAVNSAECLRAELSPADAGPKHGFYRDELPG